MRKTSYFVTFCFVVVILTLNVLSARSPEWLIVHYHNILYTEHIVSYGLVERCELTISEVPGKIAYRNRKCRNFPASVTDGCQKDNKAFCAAWTSAGYLDQMAIGFAAISLAAIAFGVSTHSRRRRIWRAVAGLLLLQAVCQISTFAIVADSYRNARYPAFEHAVPGAAFVLHTVAWVLSILASIAVVVVGVSAKAGHRWAAGNRAYQPIQP
ncbi:hypothetical protein CPB84DRAFT_1835062, partial [Gymnopilus junonius]